MAMLVPNITVSDGTAAIEFYKKALGAVEVSRLPAPDGRRILHAALKIGEGMLFLADEFPDLPTPDGARSPKSVGGTTVTIHLQSPDVDRTLAAAAAAGATITLPASDMYWGERYGRFRDPFGHLWSVATATRQVGAEDMAAAAKKAYGNVAK
jgi:PhnB protein